MAALSVEHMQVTQNGTHQVAQLSRPRRHEVWPEDPGVGLHRGEIVRQELSEERHARVVGGIQARLVPALTDIHQQVASLARDCDMLFLETLVVLVGLPTADGEPGVTRTSPLMAMRDQCGPAISVREVVEHPKGLTR